jgi:ABC-type polysaccharide transport system permease subunit
VQKQLTSSGVDANTFGGRRRAYAGIEAQFHAAGKDLRQNWHFYLMALPCVIAIILFGYGPLRGLIIAFLDYSPLRGFSGSEWVGLDNFRAAFDNPFFATALRNTILINTAKLAVGFPAAIVLALLMNEVRLHWFKRVIQISTIMPYFVSWVVAATVFRNLLSPEGLINQIIVELFGRQAITFLSDPDIFPWVIVFQDTWKYCGFFAVLYLAAMTTIDPTLYEAAMVDGANRWQQTWHITLPGIRPTMITLFVLLTGWIFQGGFEQILVMYNTSVFVTGDILETFTLRLALQQSKYGLATAVGLFQTLISLILVVVANRLVKRMNDRGIF